MTVKVAKQLLVLAKKLVSDSKIKRTWNVVSESAPTCLLGKPANSVWQTENTGFRADIWEEYDDGMKSVVVSKSFPTRPQAEAWAKAKVRG